MTYRSVYLSLALICVACGGSGASQDAGRAGANSAAGSGADAGGICTYVPGNEPSDCPNDLPAACSQPAPSYSSDVSPIIGTYCVPCHRTGGLAPDKPFGTYAPVSKLRTDILGRVSRCIMPPLCAAQPTPDERAKLLSWLVCGAPNN
jgi:hypothetical protein